MKSKIEWTDFTFNPWWGCVKVSPGCENCYAETLSNRWKFNVWGPEKTTDRRLFGDKHWKEPLMWNEAARNLPDHFGKKVFCGSMCDILENHIQVNSSRNRLFQLIEETQNLIWLLLSKRIENAMKMFPESWKRGLPDNVWVGTSVEDQKRADERIPVLLEIPAAVHFLSCEPLLEQPNLSNYIRDLVREIDWIIVGGESGPGKRQFNVDWARSIRDQCKDSGIAFFMKQIDKVQPIPEDLMIREFPQSKLIA